MAYTTGFSTVKEFARTRLSVTGTIPEWLRGDLYRVGPGKFEIARPATQTTFKIQHWFDGLSLLHHFSVETDGVYYRNQFMSKGREKLIAEGMPCEETFAQDPCTSIFYKTMLLFRPRTSIGPPDVPNINVSVSRLADSSFVLKTDASILQEFDPSTLLPKRAFRYEHFGPELSGVLSAAHEQVDTERCEYVNFVMQPGRSPFYRLFSLTGNKMTPRVVADIHDRPAYVHSFSMTPNYIIFPVYPYTFNMLKVLWTRSLRPALSWNPDLPTRFHVVHRHTGAVQVYESKAMFCFHTINAFEDERGDLVADYCMYEDPSVIDALYVNPPSSVSVPETFSIPFHHRLRFASPPAADASPSAARPARPVEIVRTGDLSIEMPRINPDRSMKRYSFVYGTHLDAKYGTSASPFSDQLIKLNVESGQASKWVGKPGQFPSEPIFIARPDAQNEDDGVVLSIVLDATLSSPKSFMLVLDAASYDELARVEVPAALPFTIHGEYFSA